VVLSSPAPYEAPASDEATWLVITWHGSSEVDAVGGTVAFIAVGTFTGFGRLPITVVGVGVKALPVGPHAASTAVTASAVTPIVLRTARIVPLAGWCHVEPLDIDNPLFVACNPFSIVVSLSLVKFQVLVFKI
jgi:hypothetical protein